MAYENQQPLFHFLSYHLENNTFKRTVRMLSPLFTAIESNSFYLRGSKKLEEHIIRRNLKPVTGDSYRYVNFFPIPRFGEIDPSVLNKTLFFDSIIEAENFKKLVTIESEFYYNIANNSLQFATRNNFIQKVSETIFQSKERKEMQWDIRISSLPVLISEGFVHFERNMIENYGAERSREFGSLIMTMVMGYAITYITAEILNKQDEIKQCGPMFIDIFKGWYLPIGTNQHKEPILMVGETER